MNFASFISSAVGGSLFGGVLNLATGWVETLRKGKEAKIEIMLMEARSASAEKVAAWQSFEASQKQDEPFAVPTGTWPWAASLFVVVEAVRRITRPGLTWALLAFVAYAYTQASTMTKAAEFSDITFAAFTALFWWFGERYSKARK